MTETVLSTSTIHYSTASLATVQIVHLFVVCFTFTLLHTLYIVFSFLFSLSSFFINFPDSGDGAGAA